MCVVWLKCDEWRRCGIFYLDFHSIRNKVSSISLWLLGRVVKVFVAIVDELDCVGILSPGHGLLTHLIFDEGLGFLDIVKLSIRKTEMVSLIISTEAGGQDVRDCHKEELGHVDQVHELISVSDVEPHPIPVCFHSEGLETQELQISGASASPPMSVGLVLPQKLGVVLLDVVIVGVVSSTVLAHPQSIY